MAACSLDGLRYGACCYSRMQPAWPARAGGRIAAPWPLRSECAEKRHASCPSIASTHPRHYHHHNQ
eukprot:10684481-Lingulodinium_polyedra.AAC.1